ncbi:hypothetical protein LOAG_05489 [Loa loa]|uniref:Carbohydrate kinase FGGY N-terminal domain-containing protein n=1 Tax=Loa loa TaxID=7209 RepID=A0A1S0U039_LOALO|nr:hypothetical protein LOAG_05489 [Loa loa]EFO22996.1 hypothetical protein LOAG_05489 [Loa loa]
MFGTMDSWLIYKLTGERVTDVANASWTSYMLIKRSLNGISISGCLGDQQAAMLGECCFEPVKQNVPIVQDVFWPSDSVPGTDGAIFVFCFTGHIWTQRHVTSFFKLFSHN